MANPTYIIAGDLMQAVVSRIAAAPTGQFYDVFGALVQTIGAQDKAYADEAANANQQENAAPLLADEKAV